MKLIKFYSKKMKFLTTIFSKFLLLIILFLTSCLQEPAKVINRSALNFNKSNQFNQEKYRNIVQKKSDSKSKTLDNQTNKSPSLTITQSHKNNEIIVKQGETLYSIAKANDVALREIIEHNNLGAPYQLKAGDKIKIPYSNYHESRDGDTLYSISRMYDMKVNDLITLNNLKFPYAIYPGDKIKIIQRNYNNSKVNITKNFSTNNSKNQKISNENQQSKSQFSSTNTISNDTSSNPNLNATKINYKTAYNSSNSDFKTSQSSPNNRNLANQNVKNIINPSKNEIVETKLIINKPIDKNTIKKIANKNNEFCWPVQGQVISRFGPKSTGMFNDGINIKARDGQSVIASEDGIIAYVGDELKGYGNLVIIKHAGGWISAYAHLKNYGVELGQKINKGQKIGIVGNSGKVKSPQLYFGLRKGREAVNPENYLKS